jgi:hypothetical protein
VLTDSVTPLLRKERVLELFPQSPDAAIEAETKIVAAITEEENSFIALVGNLHPAAG